MRITLSVCLVLATATTLAHAQPAEPIPVDDPFPEPEPPVEPTDVLPPAPDGEPAPTPEPAPEATPEVPTASGVRGTVVDKNTGDPIAGVVIETADGKFRAITDARGEFDLNLRPGTYTLRVAGPFYQRRRIAGVIVRRGSFARLDARLSSEESEVVVVMAPAENKTEAGVLKLRKKAAAVSDSLSAQEMSRTADSSAGDAVKRVVSATVVDGRYVYIRGLGGRYSLTLLNGVPLPSTEPDRPAVPLDLFPASLLANLTVAKSYTADLPGTFGGGTLLIETNSYPKEFELKLKLGASGDSVNTLRTRRGYEGGSLDFLGFDDGGRALPGAVPDDGPMLVGANGLDGSDVEAIGESFHNQWTTREVTSAPNLSLGASVGDTIAAGGGQVGYLATLSVGRKESAEEALVGKVQFDGEQLTYRERVSVNHGAQSASMGGIANVGWRPRPGQDLAFFSLYTHTGQAKASFVSGYNANDAQNFESNRLQFTTRALWFNQLIGQHRLLPALELRWQANVAVTSANEPDTRDSKYVVLDDGRRRFKPEPGSGERFFSELSDLSLGAGARASLALGDATTVSAGGSAQRSAREYGSRRFLFGFVGNDAGVLFLPAEQMFVPEHIGPSFRLQERTLPPDAYDASLLVSAGYLLVDDTHLDPLRINAGVRYEVATQELIGGTPFAVTDDVPDPVERSDHDILPAVNLVYAAPPAMNLRAGYSYSLARPVFRELAPFLYYDFTRRRNISGNPELLSTRIHNADLRWELFAGDRDLLAASAFYKRFNDPIEQVIVSVDHGDLSFANAEAATAYGLELEARGSLARFGPALADLAVGTNVTLLRSQIDLGDDVGAQTSAQRPLQGQSPYVINFNLVHSHKRWGLETSLLYNVSGRRLAEVGFDTLPDVYEEAFHRVDLTVSKKLGRGMGFKLAGANLLNRKVRVTQGGLALLEYRPGTVVFATLEWSR